MFRKSKYDVMKKEVEGSGLCIISLMVKLFRLNNKLKKGTISEEQINMEIMTMLENVLPLIQKVSHVGYENSKDIETVDKQKLSEYIQKKGINPTQFINNYTETKKKMTKTLMVFALFDRDNVQFPKLKSPEMALKILNGEGVENIMVDTLDSLSGETRDTFSNIFNYDFELSDLSEEDVQLLENYHNRYMIKNIYPKVTKQVTSETEIIKMSKSLGKKSS